MMRVLRTMRLEVLQLMGGTALDADALPLFQRVLQAGVAVDDEQEWRRETALLQLGDDAAPGHRGF